jgi:hypothetical protein
MVQRGRSRQTGRPSGLGRRIASALGLGAGLLLPACSTPWPAATSQAVPSTDAEIYRSAQREQMAHLEREVARLRADLDQAEDAMVAIESGLRGVQTRADAVSSLAEARIAVERARQNAPWRRQELAEAYGKLEEAEHQLQVGHSGSAVFFASRARRIAETLDAESEQVARHASTRFVQAKRANLRAGPSMDHRVVDILDESTPVFPEREQGEWMLVRTMSGPAGWVHVSLLNPR